MAQWPAFPEDIAAIAEGSTTTSAATALLSMRWMRQGPILFIANGETVVTLDNLQTNSPFTPVRYTVGNKDFTGWVATADLT